MFRQTDPKWKDTTMTDPSDLPKLEDKEKLLRWGKKGKDTLGRFGCLVTALTNAHNYYYSEVRTPEWFNQKLRDNDGYYVLRDGYDCLVGQESFIDWEVAKKVFGFKAFKDVETRIVDILDEHRYYIARVPYNPPSIMSGHYNLIVGNKDGIRHFDSDTGAIRTDWGKHPNYRVIEILF